GLDARVHKIVVNDLRDDTFFAVIWVERDGQIISVDSRPSDALALALRVDCPIYVEDEVLKSSRLAASVSDWRTWVKKTWEDTKCRSQHSAANREGPPGNAATLAAGIPTHPLSYPDS